MKREKKEEKMSDRIDYQVSKKLNKSNREFGTKKLLGNLLKGC